MVPLLLAVCAMTLAASPFPHYKDGDWHWVPMTGSKCANGKETGVYIKYGSSTTKLGVYHAGGGACFNPFTCNAFATNPHPGAPGAGGIYSATDSRNPFKDFTWIFVPYCTGDVHLGDAAHQFDGSFRNFAGHNNIRLVAQRAVATFPDLDALTITGESAGGFGAAASYDFYRSQWPKPTVRALLLDDSGPVLDDTAIAPCLQERWRTTWNINASLPTGCPCVGNKGNIWSVWNYTMTKWPQDSFGLISSLQDSTISTFFSFGDNNCHTLIPIGYHKLEAGLQRLSKTGVPVYMIAGTEHTHTGGKAEFYTREVSNTFLYKWVAQLAGPGPNPGSVSP